MPPTAPPPSEAPEAVVLSIGDEVLRGEVVNTNAAWLGAQLAGLGFRVVRHLVVADRESEIVAAFEQAAAQAGLVVVTGGLGPTGDDLTVDAAAVFLRVGLAEHEPTLAAIAGWTNRPVGGLSSGARRMARVPGGAGALPNPCGSAPGIHFAAGSHFFLLPGVPHEMRAIFAGSVRPAVEGLFPGRARRLARHWHLASWPESSADAEARSALGGLLGPGRIELGTVLGRGWVTLRAVAEGPEAGQLLEQAHGKIAARFGAALWSSDPGDSLEAAVARELTARGLKLALAESCTGGLVAARLVGIPGISSVLLEAIVTYSNEAKTDRLGVPRELIERHGAVSRECAEAMATGLRTGRAADITLAVTGIAGPDGGTADKPAGTVHFAVAGPGGVRHDVQRFGGSREWVRERAASHGLWMILAAAVGTG
jgi:nicotinamide-nucleotide amidase